MRPCTTISHAVLALVTALACACSEAPAYDFDSTEIGVNPSRKVYDTATLVLIGTTSWAARPNGRFDAQVVDVMVDRAEDGDALARKWLYGVATAMPNKGPQRFARSIELDLDGPFRVWPWISGHVVQQLPLHQSWGSAVFRAYVDAWMAIPPYSDLLGPDPPSDLVEQFLRTLPQMTVNVDQPFARDEDRAVWIAALCDEEHLKKARHFGNRMKRVLFEMALWKYRHHPDPDVRAAAELCFAR